MAARRRNDAFNFGQGIEPEQHICADCGYAHPSRKNFKRSEDGEHVTCSTGHYEKDGEMRRAKNTYARGR